MYTLFISTFDKIITIGLLKDGKVLDTNIKESTQNHSVYTMPMIESILNNNNLQFELFFITEEKKDKKDREFLHDLKEAMEKWDNIPNKKVLEDAENIIKNYLGLNHLFFVNIREPQSIESFSQLVM